jgi:competence protein ComEC
MRTLLAIVGGCASGIALRSLFPFGWEPIAFCFLLALLCCGAFLFSTARITYLLLALFLVAGAIGMFRADVAESPLPQAFADDLKRRVTYTGVVAGDPDVRDSNQRVPVKVSKGEETTKILAVIPRATKLRVGETVSISGTLSLPEPFEGDTGRLFRYDKYLEKSGIRFMMSFATARVVRKAPWYSLSANLAKIKRWFLDGVTRALPEPHASLSGGILIGGKSGLGTELKDAFTRVGIVHIIVLSGYNVMIVAEWAILLLGKTPLRKRFVFSAGAVAIALFVGIAGAGTTAVRAGVMALIAVYARATGHTYAAGRALIVTALAMILWNPLYLVYDPGFGLSVAATAGLIWLSPIFEMFIKLKQAFLKEAVVTTLAAQIAVLPILLYEIGNLSLVSFPANVLVAPVIPFAMAFSALAGFAGILFSWIPYLATIIGLPAYLLSAFLVAVAEVGSRLPLAAVTLPPFSFWLVLASYAALIAVTKRFSTTDQFTLAKNASI